MLNLGRLIARGRGMDARAVDRVVAALLVAGATAVDLAGRNHNAVSLIAGAVVCATVAWRRRMPPVTTAIAIMGITVYESIGAHQRMAFQPFCILLNFYTLGSTSLDRGTPRVDPLLVGVTVPAIAVGPQGGGVGNVLFTWALFIAAPYAAGRATASRGALARELRANAERLEREQEEQARRAAIEERTRIARELHDVIAHSVSVMVIQTQAARRVATADPDAARRALRSVQSCGRDALVEMRRMVGVLRHCDIALAGVTTPGLAQLGELASRARESGLPVELRLDEDRPELAPGVDLVAFRVVQEALTNAIKHAGPSRVVVSVRFVDGTLDLEVSDTGRGPAPQDELCAGVGHGLVGMRERLAIYGGELETGRRRGGGFRVKARIPIEPAVPA